MIASRCQKNRGRHLSTGDFNKLADFIHSRIGIKIPPAKKGMVQSRLHKRLNHLKLESYSSYCDYLFSREGEEKELSHFFDVITTNKTDFFREPKHFTFLVDTVLPDLIARGTGVGNRLMVWSCACSRGDEPYTLAMALKEYAQTCPGFDFYILGTDISTRVLETAKMGVYDACEIDPVPMALRKKYLLKSRDKTLNLVRIVPELRKKVHFRRLNLMDDNYPLGQQMEIIFCRNVTIYFDKATTEQLLIKLAGRLVPGGYLFMGHSEFLDCTNLPFVSVAPTVYQKVR